MERSASEQGWQDVVFPIIGSDSAGFFAIGSCVLLNGSIALTAAHNLKHAFNQSVDDEWRRKFDYEGNIKVGHGLYIMGMREQDFPVWRIENSASTSKYDVSLLELKPVNDAAQRHVVPSLTLRLCGPEVGETIVAIGFIDQVIDDEVDPPKLNATECVRTGTVLEVHKLGRDATFSTPGFVCDTEFPHGLSGGVVVDAKGKVCGIVSHGLDGQPARSYAACIWPASMLAIPGNLEGKLFRTAIQEGLFNGEGVERVFLVQEQGDPSVKDVLIDPSLEMVEEYVQRVRKNSGLRM